MSSQIVRYLPPLTRQPGAARANTSFMEGETIAAVRRFHQSIPQYRVTPLRRLDEIAASLSVGTLLVKDESTRLGLAAFKGLGGVYAVARCLAERLGIAKHKMSFPHLSQAARETLGPDITFVTATAGNHGRGVAWAAGQFGARAVVIVPMGTDPERMRPIEQDGALVREMGDGFAGSVAAAVRMAEENDWVLLQDTAWPGYERIPRWVMQGYGTMVAETLEQISAEGLDPPTEVFLQVGVGSFAAAVAAALANELAERSPTIFTVEPISAAVVFASVEAGDGKAHRLDSCGPTSMSCLACTEASSLAWPVLRDLSAGHFACDDRITSHGVDLLNAQDIPSGPSGAVCAGLFGALAALPELAPYRQAIGLDKTSRVLVFSTEGSPGAASHDRVAESAW